MTQQATDNIKAYAECLKSGSLGATIPDGEEYELEPGTVLDVYLSDDSKEPYQTECIAKVLQTRQTGEVVCMTQSVNEEDRQTLVKLIIKVIARKDTRLANKMLKIIPDYVDDKFNFQSALAITTKALLKVSKKPEAQARTECNVALVQGYKEAEKASDVKLGAPLAERRNAWRAFATEN